MIFIALLSAAIQIQLPQVDSAVGRAIRTGVFPGAVVVIGTSQEVLYSRGFGHFSWSNNSAVPSPDSTLFDLASLTKVVATTPAVMRLIETGQLRLSTRVQGILPQFTGDGKETITVRHLLAHTSGLRAFLPLNELADTPEEAKELVLAEPLRWNPGSRVVYSDLNAMLLGWVVEAVTGTSLDVFAQSELFDVSGMTQTGFGVPRSARSRVMPVGLWRGHVISGELHDQNAVTLGGVSGHAGLYSTGSDLAKVARFLLNGGTSSGQEIFSERLIETFTRRQQGNRALGWEMQDSTTRGSAGSLFSAESFGHGGFTGTSIWIDPNRDLFAIVLTNRVFGPRVRNSISLLREVRAQIADASAEWVDANCVVTLRNSPAVRC